MWAAFDSTVQLILERSGACGHHGCLMTIRHDAHVSQHGWIDEPANEMWHVEGMTCEWEHRIELESARTREQGGRACSLFGHECPGGLERARRCRQRFEQLVGKEARG